MICSPLDPSQHWAAFHSLTVERRPLYLFDFFTFLHPSDLPMQYLAIPFASGHTAPNTPDLFRTPKLTVANFRGPRAPSGFFVLLAVVGGL